MNTKNNIFIGNIGYIINFVGDFGDLTSCVT